MHSRAQALGKIAGDEGNEHSVLMNVSTFSSTAKDNFKTYKWINFQKFAIIIIIHDLFLLAKTNNIYYCISARVENKMWNEDIQHLSFYLFLQL